MEDTCLRGVKSDLRPVGFPRVEGIPAFRNALPFAGRCGSEGLGRVMRTEGASSPPYEESTTQGVPEQARVRRGTLALVALRQQAA